MADVLETSMEEKAPPTEEPSSPKPTVASEEPPTPAEVDQVLMAEPSGRDDNYQFADQFICRGRKLQCSICLLNSSSFSCESLSKMLLHLYAHCPFGLDIQPDSVRCKFSFKDLAYHCSSCNLSTVHRLLFCEHVRHHIEKKPYACGICLEKLTGIPHAKKHMTEHHDGTFFIKWQPSAAVKNIIEKLGPTAPPTDSVLSLEGVVPRRQGVTQSEGCTQAQAIVIGDDDDLSHIFPESEVGVEQIKEQKARERTLREQRIRERTLREEKQHEKERDVGMSEDTRRTAEENDESERVAQTFQATKNVTEQGAPRDAEATQGHDPSAVDATEEAGPVIDHAEVPREELTTALPDLLSLSATVPAKPVDEASEALGDGQAALFPDPPTVFATAEPVNEPSREEFRPKKPKKRRLKKAPQSPKPTEAAMTSSLYIVVTVVPAANNLGQKVLIEKSEVSKHRSHHHSYQLVYGFDQMSQLICIDHSLAVGSLPIFHNHVFNDLHNLIDGHCGACGVNGRLQNLKLMNLADKKCTVVSRIIEMLVAERDRSSHSSFKRKSPKRRGKKRKRCADDRGDVDGKKLLIADGDLAGSAAGAGYPMVIPIQRSGVSVKGPVREGMDVVDQVIDQQVSPLNPVIETGEGNVEAALESDKEMPRRLEEKGNEEEGRIQAERENFETVEATEAVEGEEQNTQTEEHAIDREELSVTTDECGIEREELNAEREEQVVIEAELVEGVLHSAEGSGEEKGKRKKGKRRIHRLCLRRAGRYITCNGGYKCLTCNYFTVSCDRFQRHVSGHLHGTSVECTHAPGHIVVRQISHCIPLNAVMKYLVRMMKLKYKTDVKPLPFSTCNHRKSHTFYSFHRQEFLRHRFLLTRLKRSWLRAKRLSKQPRLLLQSEAGQQNGLGMGKEEAVAEIHQHSEKPATEEEESSAVEDNGTSGACNRVQSVPNPSRSRRSLTDVLNHLRSQREIVDVKAPTKHFKCGVENCFFRGVDSDALHIHCLTKHSGTDDFPCAYCSKSCDSVDSLLTHVANVHVSKMISASDGKLYKCMCTGCNLNFARLGEYKAHLMNNHGHQSEYQCCFCSEQMALVESLIEHIHTHISRVMKCPYCPQSYSLKADILNHLRDTHPDKPKKINIGVKIMKAKASKPPKPREEEPLSHEEEQPPPAVAAASPVPDDALVERSPPNDLMYKCKQCNYHCNTSSTLASHENLHKFKHNMNAQYLCDVCPYSAVSKYVFHQHVQHHEGSHKVRYFECPHCKWSTNKMDKIDDHLGDRHPNMPFKFEVVQDCIEYKQDMVVCPFCHGFYIWRAEFLKHIVHTHKSEAAFQAHISGIPENDLEMVKKISVQYAKSRQRFNDNVQVASSPSPAAPEVPTYSLQSVFPGLPEPDSLPEAPLFDAGSVQIYKYHCEFCSFSSNDQDAFNSHLNEEHKMDDPYSSGNGDPSCLQEPVLSERAWPSSSAASSSRSAPGDLKLKLLSCSLCPYTTINQKNLYNHRSMHKKYENLKEGYACPYCKYRGPEIKGATFHIHKYHPGEDGIAIRISGGVLLSPQKNAPLPKRVARKSSTKQAAKASPLSYQRMGTWQESYQSPYSTSTAHGNITPQAVPALPKSLSESWMAEFEKTLPTTMIFQEPIKCPKCSFSNKVRLNLLRHLKIHASGLQSTPPRMESPSGHSTPHSESHSDEDEGSLQYCYKVANKELYQCKECAFLDKFPALVKKHHLLKHGKRTAYRCAYCEFVTAEGSSMRGHCQSQHPNAEVRAFRATQENDSGDEYSKLRPDIKIEDGTTGESLLMPGAEMLGNAYDDLVGPFMVKNGTNGGSKCKICGYHQEGASPLKRHIMAVHLKFYPFKCKYCELSMVEVNKMKKHLKMKHPNQPMVILKKRASSYSHPETSLGVRIGNSEDDDLVLEDGMHIKEEAHEELLEEDEVMEGEDEDLDQLLNTQERDFSSNLAKSITQSFLDPVDHGPKKGQKVHKCAYCGYFSRWSGIDAKRHVFSQHLRRREYTCRYCNYEGNRPGSVRSHLARVHPNMAGGIKHRRAEMECVKPIEETESMLTYAVVTDQDIPILDEESLMDPEISESIVKSFSSNLSQGSPSKKISEPKLPPQKSSSPVEEAEGMPPPDLMDDVNGEAQPCGRRQDIIWRCKLCHTLGNKIKVKTHVLAKHMKLKPLRCPYCSIYIWKRDAIRRHVQIEHPGKEIAFINVVAEKVEYINKYIESLSGKPRARTTWNCLESQQTRDVMQSQVEESEGNARYQLESSETVLNQKDLEEVKKSSKMADLWRCKLCGLVDSKNRLRYHVAVHHLKLKPVQCPHCEEYFWKWESTKKHIVREHPGQSTNVVNVLSLHSADIEKNMERIDPCASADIADAIVQAATAEEQSCTKNKDLSRLAPIAAKDMPMRCTICGMVGNRARVRYHIICHHMKLKPVKCSHCNKYFYKKQLALKHQAREHPELEPSIRHMAVDHAQYLDKNMEMVEAPQTKSFTHLLSGETAQDEEAEERDEDFVAEPTSTETFVPELDGSEYLCDKCPHRSSVLPAIMAHRKLHVMFGCCYCPFKATNASKVQTHCLARHKGHPVTYKPFDHFNKNQHESAKEDEEPLMVIPLLDEQPLVEEQEQEEEEEAMPLPVTPEVQQPVFPMREPPLFPEPIPMELLDEPEVIEEPKAVVNVQLPRRKGKGPFRCRHCSSICLYRENMKRHMRRHHPNLPKLDFDPVKDLDSIEMVGRKAALARPSTSTPKAPNTVDEFIPMEEAFEPAAPPSPPAVVASESGPISHYSCSLCDYITRDVAPTAMKHHVMIHFKYRPFFCPYCPNFRGVRSFTVKKHIRSCHRGKPPKVQEEKDEDLENKVLQHFQKIRKGKPVPQAQSFNSRTKTVYECQECGLRQESKRDIRRHLCRHIGYKPCLCAYCEFQEPDSGSMKKHFRVKHKSHGVKFIMREEKEQEKLLEEMMKASTKVITVNTPNKYSLPAPTEELSVVSDGAESDSHLFNTIENVLPEEPAQYLDERMEEDGEDEYEKDEEDDYQIGTARKSTCAYPRASAMWIKNLKKGMVIQRCPLCEYFHMRRAKVSEHMLLRHGPKTIKCSYCPAEFNYPSHVTKHNVMKHPNKPMRYTKLPDVKPVPMPPITEEIYQGLGVEGIPLDSPSPTKRQATPTTSALSSPSPKRTRTVSPAAQPPIPPLKIKLEPSSSSTVLNESFPPSDGSNSTVYFEGEPFNIPLQADADGMYRCIHCNYCTVNKEHMKMHAVSHYPPKWQCGYCPKKYHMQFRVRRHMSAAHANEPIIFVNTETGKKVRYEGKRAPLVPVARDDTPVSPIKYCCHLCSFKASTQNDLAFHLKTGHFGEEEQEDDDLGFDGEELDGVILESDEEDQDPKINSLPVVSMLNLESLSNDEFQEMLTKESVSGISW